MGDSWTAYDPPKTRYAVVLVDAAGAAGCLTAS